MQVIFLPNETEYHDLYALSGYTAGSSLLITNNTPDFIFVASALTQPSPTVYLHPVASGETAMALGHSGIIWVKGDSGPIVVQSVDGAITPQGFIDPRVFVGTQAMTVQSFVEANCKNGTQFELATADTAFAAGATRDFVVITGSNPILIKNRVFQFTGGQITTAIYRDPVYTGGTPAPYYNLSDINPMVGETQILGLPTVTNVGVQIAPSVVILGNVPQTGQAQVATNAENSPPGLERVLRPNTTYLFRTVNTSAATMAYSTKSTWYEGPLSSTAF